jgi:hypothetical protein
VALDLLDPVRQYPNGDGPLGRTARCSEFDVEIHYSTSDSDYDRQDFWVCGLYDAGSVGELERHWWCEPAVMIRDWVQRISYKPYWTLDAMELGDGTIRLTVQYLGANSTAPDQRYIAHCRTVSVRTFEEFVREAIITFHELENHETREWFRVDGKHWPGFLPHDPNAVMLPLRATGARYDSQIGEG